MFESRAVEKIFADSLLHRTKLTNRLNDLMDKRHDRVATQEDEDEIEKIEEILDSDNEETLIEDSLANKQRKQHSFKVWRSHAQQDRVRDLFDNVTVNCLVKDNEQIELTPPDDVFQNLSPLSFDESSQQLTPPDFDDDLPNAPSTSSDDDFPNSQSPSFDGVFQNSSSPSFEGALQNSHPSSSEGGIQNSPSPHVPSPDGAQKKRNINDDRPPNEPKRRKLTLKEIFDPDS